MRLPCRRVVPMCIYCIYSVLRLCSLGHLNHHWFIHPSIWLSDQSIPPVTCSSFSQFQCPMFVVGWLSSVVRRSSSDVRRPLSVVACQCCWPLLTMGFIFQQSRWPLLYTQIHTYIYTAIYGQLFAINILIFIARKFTSFCLAWAPFCRCYC